MTDEVLIKEYQDSNTLEAYEILVKRYKDPLMNFVYRFVGDRDVCTDVVQETMIKFYLNKDSYRSFAKFSTWIYTIAANLAKNELKRRKRRVIFSIDNSDDEKSPQIEDKMFMAPDRAADSEIKNEIIQKALLKVKPVYREVVILRDIQDLSYEEISEITGLAIGTVKSRINRGRIQLQKLLKNIYKE
ncbi:MAG: sigma-70 family RNA polymerase sigma factor [Ignavibacteriales bacterium]|nr:sigma-70 family RNA polymerase sigma factor [Ignavibacteriales bacterium]OGU64766.1 MAG: RNA polymerase subunit sigma-24 [Stygiobacter sp. GWC2_38_9]OGV08256.1 MAG: RNA polymerase subunit sigma-24 [Stygiobacter sp. RIFOXYB2_FULL_37_11]OGV11294.1 MAG: RNA polymerase subunit sigma-24 [Stygiobacter sp. RIFOXYA2_FULL_38_8]OGV15859.1 MAG: RNA polymerase subunit sigma-24 [Stygiobacter sp. RIFOXYC2_FULL_38_25]OGV22498.1 MAG: RNA polymerase subunit sigma-24 [Stygiobacter sp. RIFOXYC12_FULL_38_8]OG